MEKLKVCFNIPSDEEKKHFWLCQIFLASGQLQWSHGSVILLEFGMRILMVNTLGDVGHVTSPCVYRYGANDPGIVDNLDVLITTIIMLIEVGGDVFPTLG